MMVNRPVLTGILTEIPNSVWYGEGDGIGFVFDEVPQPLCVELAGLGNDHLLQVAGEQGEQQIGLDDGSSLANGEKKSVELKPGGKNQPAGFDLEPGHRSRRFCHSLVRRRGRRAVCPGRLGASRDRANAGTTAARLRASTKHACEKDESRGQPLPPTSSG